MILAPMIRLLSAWKTWRTDEVGQPDEEWAPLVLGADNQDGQVTQVLKEGREWRIKYIATFWPARSNVVLHLSPGDEVRVVGRRGGALLIEPVEPTES